MKCKIRILFLLIVFLSFKGIIYPQTNNTKYRIIKHFVAYEEKGMYCAWPNIIQANNGDILVVFCRAEEHHTPTGEILLIKSTDKGKTWSKPEIIFNTPLDDRHPSIMKLLDGRIVGFFGSSFHPTKLFEEDFVKIKAYTNEQLIKWAEYTKSEEYQKAKELAGSHLKISTDNGKSWSDSIRSPETFRAGFELEDGTIIIAGYSKNNIITIHKTNGKNKIWNWETDSIQFPNFKNLAFSEPTICKLSNGRIIMIVRTTAINPYNNQDHKNLLWETYSDDNGKTWVEPYPIPIWGFPAHILQLKDGRVLISYGYRRKPFGQRACISDDGITWKHENEIIIRDDGPNGDLGYPVSIEIEPNKILTVYYQPNVPRGTFQKMDPPNPNRKKPGILGTIWLINKQNK
ncbi:MAG TPA: sialidase family protein [Bacteroidota bacterium]|nr:sialidase family protein [Bacteroidota bacterium]